MSLPKINRLANDSRINEILRDGRRTMVPCFVIYSLPNNLNIYRLCLRVSRKIGDANVRNKIKRLVKEVFRQNSRVLPNNDYVVILTNKPVTVDLRTIKETLSKIITVV